MAIEAYEVDYNVTPPVITGPIEPQSRNYDWADRVVFTVPTGITWSGDDWGIQPNEIRVTYHQYDSRKGFSVSYTKTLRGEEINQARITIFPGLLTRRAQILHYIPD